MPSYTICRVRRAPELRGLWTGASWAQVQALEVAHFHPKSSEHRPRAQAKLQFDERHLYVQFRVEDRYVRAVSRRFQDSVWADSCVEFFARPREDRGYFNFEMSCGGVLLLYYIEDPTRTADGFVKYVKVEKRHLRGLKVYHSLPRRVEPELPGPLEWSVEYRVPFGLFAVYLGSPPPTSGAAWRGNLFKCADASSHPHWASWAPIGEELNFHQPERFGVLSFEA
jgi:hypothetical protein